MDILHLLLIGGVVAVILLIVGLWLTLRPERVPTEPPVPTKPPEPPIPTEPPVPHQTRLSAQTFIFVLLALILICAVMVWAINQNHNPPGTSQVVYRMWGQNALTTYDIIYRDADGNLIKSNQDDNLPWSVTVYAKPGSDVQVHSLAVYTGIVYCSITINSAVVTTDAGLPNGYPSFHPWCEARVP